MGIQSKNSLAQINNIDIITICIAETSATAKHLFKIMDIMELAIFDQFSVIVSLREVVPRFPPKRQCCQK